MESGEFADRARQRLQNVNQSPQNLGKQWQALVAHAAPQVPLNSEQLQILSSIRKDGCKYIIVEGPPGTGKSHTITAISFDAILNHKSVLILSDKKEALDVVEDKITETMNKVRYGDEELQNPILRLGKIGIAQAYPRTCSTL